MKRSVRKVVLRADLRLTLDHSGRLEMSVICAEVAEQYSPLSQRARSLLSPPMVLAFPTNADIETTV